MDRDGHHLTGAHLVRHRHAWDNGPQPNGHELFMTSILPRFIATCMGSLAS